jgi:hypothetical protein
MNRGVSLDPSEAPSHGHKNSMIWMVGVEVEVTVQTPILVAEEWHQSHDIWTDFLPNVVGSFAAVLDKSIEFSAMISIFNAFLVARRVLTKPKHACKSSATLQVAYNSLWIVI